MQLRSLLLAGVCAGFAIVSSAFAAPQVVDESIVPEQASSADTLTVATPKSEADAAKKKKQAKKTSTKKDAKAKEDDPKVKAAKAKEAKEKEKAKLAAKAKAEKEKLAAKAKAEKEKLAAAKAKADKERKLAADKAAKERKLAAEKAAKERQIAADKAAKERKLAADKAAKERKLAAEKAAKEREQAAKERQLAREQAEKERQIAKAKAAEERRLAAEAKAKAAEEKRLAKLKAERERQEALARAEEQRRQEAEAARKAELVRLASAEIAQTGNNGELRSEAQVEEKPQGLFAGLFGGSVKKKQSMLPETRALDAALELKEEKKPFAVKPEFVPQTVAFSGYERGTIVIDTAGHYLYLIESSSKARRYAIAVGKEGLQFKGEVKVGDKQEWPRWIPTKEMQERDPKKYGIYKDGMPGGGENPLGARAIYLYQYGKDTHLRIHGTIAPETIGTDSSNGCFRMINDHVIDLYKRVPVGTNVVVL